MNTEVFERELAGKTQGPRRPANADHILNASVIEFPDKILEKAKRACEEYELTQGKHYDKCIEHGPMKSSRAHNAAGDSMKFGSSNVTGGRRLVDE